MMARLSGGAADAPCIVVALGGNALSGPGEAGDITSQFAHTRQSLAPIVALAAEGWRIAVVHGNGPQIGDELLRHELAHAQRPMFPIGVLVASTAGWIGYMIQQSLQNALRLAGIRRHTVTVITQVIVDPPPAGMEPVKPIGRSLSRDEALRLRDELGWTVAERDGKWRRLAPSPVPRGIVDKDRAAQVLADEIGASVLLIVTNVEGVYTGYGTPSEQLVRELDATRARAMLQNGELGTGSMGPKVEAAIAFVGGGTGRRAHIAALEKGLEAVYGNAGTVIVE